MKLVASLAVTCLFLSTSIAQETQPVPLPLPQANLPEHPPFLPTVITSGGQRLLLPHAPNARVLYDAASGHLLAEPGGWWLINYPIDRIEGLPEAQRDHVLQRLLGRPIDQVRNWYIKGTGPEGSEPEPPTGPAPFQPTPNPDFVVDPKHPHANDTNPGTPDRPLKTIMAAVRQAKPGTVIHIMPGLYRESVVIEGGGTAEAPIVIEGVRDPHGNMPVITGNDPFPPNSFQPVATMPGVYRAELFTRLAGTVTAAGQLLRERDLITALQPGECLHNRASRQFMDVSLAERIVDPRQGESLAGQSWRRLGVNDDGMLELEAHYGQAAKGAIFWLSSWVWVEPGNREGWHPDFPEPISGRVYVAGGWRAQRVTGVPQASQPNQYRVWTNGRHIRAAHYLTPSDSVIGLPLSARNQMDVDEWNDFALNEGWNHVIFQLDTSTRPDSTSFRFRGGRSMPAFIASATKPERLDRRPEGEAVKHIAEYMVLGPFPTEGPESTVYVRLPGDADPNTVDMDLSARSGHLVHAQGPFIHIRGLEVRNGASPQQTALLQIAGEGSVLEGCLVRDGEVRGIGVNLFFDQSRPMTIIRNNWIENMGNLGMGANASSRDLTPENINGDVPRRGRALFEHNHFGHTNWAAYSPMWESGGMKFFRLTGNVIRFNTFVGGHGPALWLDWEHFNNRLEGNLILDGFALGVGVEASPGPNLVANNVSRNLRPGQAWFRGGMMSWDSSNTWFVHNTVDGCWRDDPAWQGYRGTEGIRRGHRAFRKTRWCPRPHFQYDYINNLLLGVRNAIHSYKEDTVLGNLTDRGSNATPLATLPAFRNPERGDYRVAPDAAAVLRGEPHPHVGLVKYDFFGLLRFPDEPPTVGAFRIDATPAGSPPSLIEVEYTDGQPVRRYEITGG